MEENAGCSLLPLTPPGLEVLYSLCRKIYPDQPNPLQVTALLKYWLGGPDPLDYISMYANPGDPDNNIPAHWHYISFGLSDLHGDGRVHEPPTTNPPPSGFGFELTFRLKRNPSDASPPTWPATLMQSLAKYVFQSGNQLCIGDHVSWHCGLDGSDSRIRHMLMVGDSQMGQVVGPFGAVEFVQIVGVMGEELKAAQQWNGVGVLDLIKNIPDAGGAWHITDMKRDESIFELDVRSREQVERGFEVEGSNLSGVSARCSWREDAKTSDIATEPHEATKYLKSVHLVFNLEAGSLLPLAIRGRVKHGRHFTFKSILGEGAITLVASTVEGKLVERERKYAVNGCWLQVLIEDEMVDEMANTFQVLANPEALQLPKTFDWPDQKLSITIVPDKI